MVDMIRLFTTPFATTTGIMTYKRSAIVFKYLKRWFWFDLFAFYPLAYLRYNSNYNDGGFNDWDNWKM